MYTAPPSGDDGERTGEKTDAETQNDPITADEATDAETPELESTTSATDANWTGTVPADD